MKRAFISFYKNVFVRKALYHFHHRLLNVSLWGLGILNSENDYLSGEDYFLRHLGKILKPENKLVVFDVGANRGSYANKVRALYPQALIYAFEPAPLTFELLKVNSEKHGYLAVNCALSNISGHRPFYNRAGNTSEHASLFQEVITDIHNDDVIQIDVPVSTVDEFTQQHQIPHLHLLKTDTEGNDLNVLLGAQRLLKAQAIDVIQFEFNTMNVISRVFLRDFRSLLEGYKLYRLLPDGLVLLKPNPTFLSEIFAYQNIVALRDQG